MRRLNIFMITIALIAGTVGCAPAQYNLTISATEGGEVTTPSGATHTYEEGTLVPLVAFPHSGYRFVNWTGDVNTIDDVSAASTTITMNGDYAITANFELEQEEEAPTELLLGAVLPITGIFAGSGEQGFGMQKAVDDQNALGGIYLSKWNVTVPVRLIIKDNESDCTQLEPLSEELLLTDEVHALLSPSRPCGPHDLASVADEYGVPQIICGGPFEPWYFGPQGGLAPYYTWFSGFAIETRSAAPRHVDGYTMIDTWFKYMDMVNAKANTNLIAGVFGSDDAGDGTYFYESFPPLMGDYGMTVVGAEEELGLFPMGTTDYSSIVTAWKDANVEIIWGNSPAPHFRMLLEECYRQGFRPKICLVARAALVTVDVASWGTDPPLGWGVGAEVWWSPRYDAADGFEGIGDRTAASLAEDWATEVGEPLDPYIGPGYMAAQVMLDAIERAGDVDGDAINEALGATDLNTIDGWVKFDPETHFSAQPICFGQWFYDEDDEDEPFTLYIVSSALDFIPTEADPIFFKPW